MTWKVMLKSALKKWKLANKKTEQLYKVSAPCLDDQQFKEEELETVGELSKTCLLKLFYLPRTGRQTILWYVNKNCHEQSQNGQEPVTNAWVAWCRTVNPRVITDNFAMCVITAQHRRLGLFQDSDFAGDLEDSKSTSGGISCIFGSRTFVPVRWMCKKQTSVSHSSTESEVISSDESLRIDGIPSLDFWDLVIEVLHSSLNQPVQGNLCDNEHSWKRINTRTKKHSNRDDLKLIHVDHVTTNAKLSHQEPTCRHPHHGQFHFWTVESPSPFVQQQGQYTVCIQPFQLDQLLSDYVEKANIARETTRTWTSGCKIKTNVEFCGFLFGLVGRDQPWMGDLWNMIWGHETRTDAFSWAIDDGDQSSSWSWVS